MITIILSQPIASLFMSRCGACFVAMGLTTSEKIDHSKFITLNAYNDWSQTKKQYHLLKAESPCNADSSPLAQNVYEKESQQKIGPHSEGLNQKKWFWAFGMGTYFLLTFFFIDILSARRAEGSAFAF
jgi:hypothetical protein